jgi:hypothetical protein
MTSILEVRLTKESLVLKDQKIEDSLVELAQSIVVVACRRCYLENLVNQICGFFCLIFEQLCPKVVLVY